MAQSYFIAFLLAFFTSIVITPLVRRWGLAVGAYTPIRKRDVHTKPIPRVGGVVIMLSFIVPFFLNFNLDRRLWALLLGVLIMFTVGLIDDIRGMNVWHKLVWQIIAAVVVLAGGIGIIYLTNPLGGTLILDSWRIPLELFGFEFNFIPLANLVSVIWIVGLINTVNFLDGLDGLATVVTSIAALVMFVLALSPLVFDTNVALISLILAGALLGFLPYNFFPSSIFLGDSGAYVIGMLLATLSIYAGSKVAVGALVLGIAIIDAVWVVTRRIMQRKSPFSPDRSHLHHQLLASGFSQKQAVLLIYIMVVTVAAVMLLAGGVSAFVVLLTLLVGAVSIIRIRTAKTSI